MTSFFLLPNGGWFRGGRRLDKPLPRIPLLTNLPTVRIESRYEGGTLFTRRLRRPTWGETVRRRGKAGAAVQDAPLIRSTHDHLVPRNHPPVIFGPHVVRASLYILVECVLVLFENDLLHAFPHGVRHLKRGKHPVQTKQHETINGICEWVSVYINVGGFVRSTTLTVRCAVYRSNRSEGAYHQPNERSQSTSYDNDPRPNQFKYRVHYPLQKYDNTMHSGAKCPSPPVYAYQLIISILEA